MPSTEAELKKAYTAFKKKVKHMQLEDDSKLGRSHTTGPRTKVSAVQPPPGFGKDIWDELVTQGKLKYDGNGFYALAGK